MELKKKTVDDIAKSLGFMVKRTSDCNAFYYLVDEQGFDLRNAKGEKLCVEIGRTDFYGNSKDSLPALWYKNGYTNEIMQNWWNVQTYVTDKDGECYGAYNPTIKPAPAAKRFVINFDWHLSATEENFRKLIEEVKRQFLNS